MKFGYNTFKDTVLKKLTELLGEGIVEEYTKTKTNGIKAEGVFLKVDNAAISPLLYFGDTERIYDDDDVELFIEKALDSYKETCKHTNTGVEHLRDWDAVKNYIRPRIINYRKNEERLMNMPHIRIMDLATIFVIPSENVMPEYENGRIEVTEFLMKCYEVDEVTMYKQAIENLEREGYEFASVGELLNIDELEVEGNEKCASQNKLHMLSCRDGIGGAVTMLSNKILSETCQKMECERIYVLPSSVNEVLVLNVEEIDVESLQKLVKDVNETIVLPEEFLSDCVYLYDSVSDELKNMGEANDEQNGLDHLSNIA